MNTFFAELRASGKKSRSITVAWNFCRVNDLEVGDIITLELKEIKKKKEIK